MGDEFLKKEYYSFGVFGGGFLWGFDQAYIMTSSSDPVIVVLLASINHKNFFIPKLQCKESFKKDPPELW